MVTKSHKENCHIIFFRSLGVLCTQANLESPFVQTFLDTSDPGSKELSCGEMNANKVLLYKDLDVFLSHYKTVQLFIVYSLLSSACFNASTTEGMSIVLFCNVVWVMRVLQGY